MPTEEQLQRALIYRNAATEHLLSSRLLYSEERYVLSAYVSGLAVECMLRAYRYRMDPDFDSRHDLDRLYDLAKFATIVPDPKLRQVELWLLTLVRLWSNDLRFMSEDALRRKWKKMRLDRGIKGDFVKAAVYRLQEASVGVLLLGAAQRNSSLTS